MTPASPSAAIIERAANSLISGCIDISFGSEIDVPEEYEPDIHRRPSKVDTKTSYIGEFRLVGTAGATR
jgi:hypothetical protein